MVFRKAHRVAAVVAAIHFIAVCLTYWYVSAATVDTGQTGLVWVYWLFVDFPWSLPLWQLMSDHLFVIHGVIGTAWWYLLVVLIGRVIAFAKSKLGRPHAP